MKYVIAAAMWTVVAATALPARASDTDTATGDTACQRQVEARDKGAFLKWWVDRTNGILQSGGFEALPNEAYATLMSTTEMRSHWSRRLQTCLAILVTNHGTTEGSKAHTNWSSIVFDAAEGRLVANIASGWLGDENIVVGAQFQPTLGELTLDDFRILITE